MGRAIDPLVSGPVVGQARTAPLLSPDAPADVGVTLRQVDLHLGDREAGLELEVATAAAAVLGGIGGALIGYQLDRQTFHWGCDGGCEDPGLIGLLGGRFAGPALAQALSAVVVERQSH